VPAPEGIQKSAPGTALHPQAEPRITNPSPRSVRSAQPSAKGNLPSNHLRLSRPGIHLRGSTSAGPAQLPVANGGGRVACAGDGVTRRRARVYWMGQNTAVPISRAFVS
jgi:hypothetical protein